MQPDHTDMEEVKKFDALADQWWDPNGKFKPLHQINPLRVDYIKQHVELHGAKILDVGCGGGLLAESLARLGAEVTGIDRSKKALAVASLHAEKEGLHIPYIEADAQSWAENHRETYDVITCMEVLEHVPDVMGTVDACAHMLKPNGTFFFATLNRTLKSFLFAIVGAEYILGWLPKGTHRYTNFIRPSELADAVRHAGLQLQDLKGMSYLFHKDRFELSSDLSVNYLGYARKAH